jgi:hypothetical protein
VFCAVAPNPRCAHNHGCRARNNAAWKNVAGLARRALSRSGTVVVGPTGRHEPVVDVHSEGNIGTRMSRLTVILALFGT